ncbi:MAG: (2Fe-2S)-binding protein [Labilithrix sp.]|nr:(2Fe-2S)-binding protein [Labilithrix sp.]MCW5836371.1 (2Fe-2S)-binding protein [Labilithrix sp.]
MYVCVCLAVSDQEVRSAIESGATTREAVTRVCGAGGDCGACHGMIATMIEDHVEESGPIVCCPASAAERLVPDSALVRTRAA